MGGVLDGPWFRKGDNVFLGNIKAGAFCLAIRRHQRSLRHWNWQEEKMNWVPGFNHDPCELKEAGTLEPAVLPGALKQFQL